ncbi:hypothetical protein [Streptomyces cucumeris]
MTRSIASRDDEFNATSPTLEATIGHPANTVHEVLKAAVRSR